MVIACLDALADVVAPYENHVLLVVARVVDLRFERERGQHRPAPAESGRTRIVADILQHGFHQARRSGGRAVGGIALEEIDGGPIRGLDHGIALEARGSAPRRSKAQVSAPRLARERRLAPGGAEDRRGHGALLRARLLPAMTAL